MIKFRLGMKNLSCTIVCFFIINFFFVKNIFEVDLQYLINVVILFITVKFLLKVNFVLKKDKKNLFFKTTKKFTKTFGNPVILIKFFEKSFTRKFFN